MAISKEKISAGTEPASSDSNRADQMIREWVRPEIQALQAYHVPDPGQLIKLDAMENPFAWPDSLVEEWLAVLRDVSLNRYPDSSSRKLMSRLRSAYDFPEDAEILLGNGSDELIQMIALAVTGAGRVVLAVEPSFSMYRMIATYAGMEYVSVPLNANGFTLDVPGLLDAIKTYQPAVIFLDYPNNPSGNLFDEQDLCEVIEASNSLVVVDEAYHAFAGTTFMSYLKKYKNLLILRTLSKMGLAGLRLGVLVGDSAWVNEINKIRLPYNINVLTQISAEFALSHQAVFEDQTRTICHERQQMYEVLSSMEGVTAYPSFANFILFRVPEGRSAEIFESLKTQGVLIKNLHKQDGLLRDCLRVTIGLPAENKAFLQALSSAL